MMKIRLRPIQAPLLAAALLALSACVAPMPFEGGSVDQPQAAQRATGAQAPAPALPGTPAAFPMGQYLIVQGDQVGLVNVADEDGYTFFQFNGPPTVIQLFDQDGKPLPSATSGNILGVQGVFKGVLLRKGSSNSFVAPNPRATRDGRTKLVGDPGIAAVMRELDAKTIAMPAFQRAMELADGKADARTSAKLDAPPAKAPARPDPADPVKTPDGTLYRVFFATSGRAVVAPDDGLSRIEDAASAASFIRITGFADGAGSSRINVSLARTRAYTIRDYLVRRGVEPGRIWVGWSGTGGYLGDNATAEGRALNRRAEVLIKDGLAQVAKEQAKVRQ